MESYTGICNASSQLSILCKKNARASISKIKDAHTQNIRGRSGVSPLAIFESIINISSSSNNSAILSVIFIAKVQVIAAYDAVVKS